MLRSLIVVAQNFQDEEFIYPYYKLKEFSEVSVASSDGEDRLGKYGVPARVTHKFSDIKTDNLDVLLIPGGFECPDRLRIDKECIRIVKECAEKNILIAAICHGPWVLISAKVTNGIPMTGYLATHTDLENSGAIIDSKNDVVVAENFITAQHYKNNPEFMLAVQKKLNERIS